MRHCTSSEQFEASELLPIGLYGVVSTIVTLLLGPLVMRAKILACIRKYYAQKTDRLANRRWMHPSKVV